MKLNGHSLSNTSSSVFELRRGHQEPLTLRLSPLSLGFHQRLRSRGIIPPNPPVKIARDSGGKPLRDGAGLAVTYADRQDAEYLTAVEVYHQRVAVLSVAESIRGDSSVRFETSEPVAQTCEAWEEYAERLFVEMELAGFTAGDLILLCREICRLSNLIDEHLTAARQNFSFAGEAGPE